jgi:ABC-type phosphate transport system substrate-binding protein
MKGDSVKMRSVLAILLLIVAHASFAAGGSPDSRALKIAGSSTILPLAELIGEMYGNKFHEPVRIAGGGGTWLA